MRLTNKVALVTSSQRDRCATTARQLAEAGASVMICGRNAAQGEATVAEIQQAGGRASFVLADIAVLPDVQAAIDETIATYGRLDILFNNASNAHECDRSLLNVNENTWDRITESTLKGIFFCCQYALPFLRNTGNGTIINVVERQGPAENYTVSGLCQGALVALTQAITQQSSQSVVANLVVSAPDLFTASTLLTEHILHGPARLPISSPQPVEELPGEPHNFLAADEAILYLAHAGNQIGGYTLVVNATPDENNPAAETR